MSHTAFRRRYGLVVATALACLAASWFAPVPRSDASPDHVAHLATSGCLVPDVHGYRLAHARSMITWSNCTLGTVKYRDAAPRMRGRVLAQSVPADTLIPTSRAIRVTVGS